MTPADLDRPRSSSAANSPWWLVLVLAATLGCSAAHPTDGGPDLPDALATDAGIDAAAPDSAIDSAAGSIRGEWRSMGSHEGDFGSGADSWASLDLAPDQDGDGVSEVVLGLPLSPVSATAQGRLRVLRGEDLALIDTIENPTADAFGYGIASLGDRNGDGRTDYAVGVAVEATEPSFRGRLELHLSRGSSGYTVTTIPGTEPEGFFGRAVTYVGGPSAIVVAARPSFRGGRAVGIDARSGTIVYTTESSPLDADGESARRGYVIARVSDLTGDTVPEVVLGAPGQDPGAPTYEYPGRAYFYDGASGALLAIVEGPDAGSQIGMGIAEIGDVDGDGAREYLIGAPYATPGAERLAGEAFVVDGRPLREGISTPRVWSLGASPELIVRRHSGTASVELLGFDVTSLSDLDGDGVDEYAISAPGAGTAPRAYAGAVRIHDGATGAVIHTLDGIEGGHWLGEKLLYEPGTRSLYVASWHCRDGAGRLDGYRWTER